MEITKTLRLSVHDLVDFMLRSGDIDNRIFNKASMQMGTKLHQAYQSAQSGAFEAEKFLKHTYVVDEFAVTIEGYADGIREILNKVYIEEIKTTVADLDQFSTQHEAWHTMQAFIYGHMYALDHNLDTVRIRIIYINQADQKTMIKSFERSVSQLSLDIDGLISEYLSFYRSVAKRIEARNDSVKQLPFPFKHFRFGQRELAKYVYSLARSGGTLFAEAPTGIGKTISTLYPTVLSFGQGIDGKVFYVTAKNSGHEAAAQAMAYLRQAGAKACDITLTAKDKICFTPGAACNPDECPFAKGYYDKIRHVLHDALDHEVTFDRHIISSYAGKYELCPFELQLDLSLFTDVIIADYNYVFDPMVYLRRFFDADSSAHFLLVDEAHNLLERSRSMYSTSLSRHTFDKMRKKIKAIDHPKFKKTITKLNKLFKTEDVKTEDYQETITLDNAWFKVIDAFLIQAQDVMRKVPKLITEEFKDFYFDANRFLKMADYFDEHFVYYRQRDEYRGYTLNMFCLDSSALLAQVMKPLKGRVLFSATLSPFDYYVPMLGGQSSDAVLRLPSPFPKDNLLLMVAPKVSTRYKSRQATLDEVALYIEIAIKARLGNYLVFFPSYKYMNDVLAHMKTGTDVQIIAQTSDMDLSAQSSFLDNFRFNPSNTTVGFVVLGGPFSEGIDLIEDRLIGSIVVGVGLPQLSFERDLIKQYFNQLQGDGYAFSYAFPGMNRVMQAVGRVIRSEKDRGIALLIDDRYLETRYRTMFKAEWAHYEAVITPDDLQALLDNFWKSQQN
ncbi:MAG TPA: ATP-dependent DNA helicase [Bacilli bacterium]|nr:ATP-dependent DNA helicase [Bacilli bacterium]